MANGPTGAKPKPNTKILLENLTRTVYNFGLEETKEDPHRPGRRITKVVAFVRLGDKADTPEKVPETGRDPKLQPEPTLTLTQEGWDKLGSHNQRWIESEIEAGRIRRTELSA